MSYKLIPMEEFILKTYKGEYFDVMCDFYKDMACGFCGKKAPKFAVINNGAFGKDDFVCSELCFNLWILRRCTK